MAIGIFQHMIQFSHTISYFNYGRQTNMERYGQEEPPAIPLENISGIPIMLCLASEDTVTTPEDINQLIIDNNIGPIVVNNTYFMGHSSTVTGSDMGYLDDVYDQLQLYPPQLSA